MLSLTPLRARLDAQCAFLRILWLYPKQVGCHTVPHVALLQVMKEITSGEALPWEEGRISATHRRQVGVFYGTLLTLLVRDPAARPSMQAVCAACNRLLSSTTTHDG